MLGADTLHETVAKRLYVSSKEGSWLSIERHKPDDAWQLQNPQTLGQRQPHEHVARKEHEIKFFAAILPAACRSINGEKVLNPALLKLLCHLLLVTRVSVSCVPASGRGICWKEAFSGLNLTDCIHSFALSLTGHL
jgi:hypothetical protein